MYRVFHSHNTCHHRASMEVRRCSHCEVLDLLQRTCGWRLFPIRMALDVQVQSIASLDLVITLYVLSAQQQNIPIQPQVPQSYDPFHNILHGNGHTETQLHASINTPGTVTPFVASIKRQSDHPVQAGTTGTSGELILVHNAHGQSHVHVDDHINTATQGIVHAHDDDQVQVMPRYWKRENIEVAGTEPLYRLCHHAARDPGEGQI